MVVLKFGGSSVGTKGGIEAIHKIVEKEINNSPVVVVSALKGVTDLLFSLTKETRKEQKSTINSLLKIHTDFINEVFDINTKGTSIKYTYKTFTQINSLLKQVKIFTPQTTDEIISFGEIISSYIVSEFLRTRGIKNKQIIASSLIVTNSKFGNADYIKSLTKKRIASSLVPLLDKKIVPIVTGFIGASRDGKITTLGRGGSDYSATIIGSSLPAKDIQIWTDVDGVSSADPNLINNSAFHKHLSYEIADAFATSGAKILHPKTLKPAMEQEIPVKVLNTFNHLSKGTLISTKSNKYNKYVFMGIALKENPDKKSTIFLIGRGAKNLIESEKLIKFLAPYKHKLKITMVNEYKLSFRINSKDTVITKELYLKLYDNFVK